MPLTLYFYTYIFATTQRRERCARQDSGKGRAARRPEKFDLLPGDDGLQRMGNALFLIDDGIP